MVMTHQFSTFYLDHLLFGLEVSRVQEIIRYQKMTPVPLAPAMIAGLINLRGQIVTAIDLRRRLELADRPADRLPVNVIVRAGDEAVSLLVDEIGDVLEVEEEMFEPSPETLQGTARELILGAYKLKERLLLVLEPEKTVGLSEYVQRAIANVSAAGRLVS
jgi:purine-binding chemotaxis protein CheW